MTPTCCTKLLWRVPHLSGAPVRMSYLVGQSSPKTSSPLSLDGALVTTVTSVAPALGLRSAGCSTAQLVARHDLPNAAIAGFVALQVTGQVSCNHLASIAAHAGLHLDVAVG